jgi:hypothetical protein
VTLSKINGDAVVHKGLWLATGYAVATAWVAAFQMPHIESSTRVLGCLSAMALLDGARLHPAIRETGLMLVRGCTVTALFVASAEFGPTPMQAQRTGQILVLAALLGFLVMVAQARRAAENREEQRANASLMGQLATDLRSVRNRLADTQGQVAPAAARGSTRQGTLLVAATGLFVGAYLSQRRGRAANGR